MSAPELPDIFGNYALGEDFAEVVSPEAISWLPQTSGWKWLTIILAALLLRYLWRRIRHWYRNRYRREALARLNTLAKRDADEQWLGQLSELLKLTALAAYPRQEVASLTGNKWVSFLNEQCAQPVFSASQKKLLADASYSGHIPASDELAQLIQAAQQWIEIHAGTTDV